MHLVTRSSNIVETSRLNVRQLRDEDVSTLSEMLADPEVMKYSVRGVMTPAQTHEFVDWCKRLYLEKGYGPWALETKDKSEFIGFAGLTPTERNGIEEADLGYRLARAFWEKGFATEAAAKVLEYGFSHLGRHSIFCTVLPEHTASIKVAEKVGFSSFELSTSNEREVRVYQMSAEEWEKMHNNTRHGSANKADR